MSTTEFLQAPPRISSFTNLIAWQIGHQLVIQVYKITEAFPHSELFGLTSQLKRAVVSITSNLAEGFSRRTYNEKLHFYSIALGSLTEVQNQLLIARDVGYVKNEDFTQLADLSVRVSKLLNSLISKTKTLIPTRNSRLVIRNSTNS